ncbi:MAG TPA: hypothetical protein VM050_03905 [Patescibacteria group bacterium]|nr:hypothetical protein [Patescibacteria group bacterium]
MFSNHEVTPEEEDEVIMRVAQEVRKRRLGVPAIMLLETLNPLSFVSATMGRFFLSPVLPALGEDLGMKGEIILQVFEKHKNIERLVSLIEAMEEEDKAKAAEERRKEETVNGEAEEEKSKKGWRRFLPF